MTETKWTPGDWENQGEDAFADMPFIRIGVGDRTICEVLPPVDAGEIDDETRANANLTAAASDLYASVERLLLEFDFMIERGVIPDCRNDIIFDNALAAMRKARGE